jgi:hypothetical protein
MSSVDPTLKHIGNVLEKSASELARGINHVLAICIDEYHHQPRLYNCVKDVTDILAILTLNYGFSMDNVTELYNERATKQNILIALDDFAHRLEETDCLVVVFSGHGEVRRGIGFWIPVDAESFPDYLPVSTIRDYLEPIQARHIFVIADACFAGRFFVHTKSVNKDWSVFVERHSSRYALTAGRDEPVSDGRPGENSPFADALKYRLNMAEGSIGAIKLSEQVLEDVIKSTDGFQTPEHGEVNIAGNHHGQFFFHKEQAHVTKGDRFIDVFFEKGGDLFPPGDRTRVQEFFDDYDRFFNRHSEIDKNGLRRLNTERYLEEWGLSIAILKEKLKLLGFYRGTIDDNYTEDLPEAISGFQRDSMMRQIDGYFGELTYERMVAALIMSGLAKYPSDRHLHSVPI